MADHMCTEVIYFIWQTVQPKHFLHTFLALVFPHIGQWKWRDWSTPFAFSSTSAVYPWEWLANQKWVSNPLHFTYSHLMFSVKSSFDKYWSKCDEPYFLVDGCLFFFGRTMFTLEITEITRTATWLLDNPIWIIHQRN